MVTSVFNRKLKEVSLSYIVIDSSFEVKPCYPPTETDLDRAEDGRYPGLSTLSYACKSYVPSFKSTLHKYEL